MPIDIFWDQFGLEINFVGEVSMADIHQNDVDLYGNEEFYETRIKYIIYDLRNTELVGILDKDAKFAAGIDKGASHSKTDLRVAILVRPDTRPLAEIYVENSKRLGSPWEFAFFDEHGDAFAWCEEVVCSGVL